MKKIFKYVMACFALVLAGGIALSACATTTDSSVEAFTTYLSSEEVTSTTFTGYKLEYKMDSVNMSATVVKKVVEGVGGETQETLQAAVEMSSPYTLEDDTTVTAVLKVYIDGTDMYVYVDAGTGEEDSVSKYHYTFEESNEYYEDVSSAFAYLGANMSQDLLDVMTEASTSGAKITKTVDGSTTTFKANLKEQEEDEETGVSVEATSAVQIVFRDGVLVELNEVYKVANVEMVKIVVKSYNGAVEFPTDISSYQDLTDSANDGADADVA